MPSLEVSDFAPWFSLPSTVNPLFHFDTVAGRRVVLFFFGSAALEPIQIILKAFQSYQEEFSRLGVLLFGVSIDRQDEAERKLSELAPAFNTFFWDFERVVSKKYGVYQVFEQENSGVYRYYPKSFILGENSRILNIIPVDNPCEHVEQVLRFVRALPPVEEPRKMIPHAPVLIIPNVLDVDFCRSLIELYHANGGTPSGFMREVNGKTVGILDDGFKRRRDFMIEDPIWQRKISNFIIRRVAPEVKKAFHFSITRFERYSVACYEAENGGFFKAHRDNTTKGTAHRRFAMTLNLNTGEYAGGYLRFPEYSPHGYKPETGDAVIFSCSLLHEVTPVTHGQRFALLSFFYGEEDAKVREAHQKFIVNSSSALGTPA